MGESPGWFVSLLALIKDGGPGVSRTHDLRFRKLRKNRLQHMLEPTHDARFIALMDRFMPQWRRCREQLNQLPLSQGILTSSRQGEIFAETERILQSERLG
jgi:hypothetical protein